jgi:SAM-dependent methyltransferase
LEQEALAKWERSAQAWIGAIRRGDVNRDRLLDAPMLALAGDVAGQDVLDMGCGEGRFCRFLQERGARTTGLDPTPTLLAEAQRLHPAGTYLDGSATNLPFPDASFDLVVSYLTLIDIEDYRAAIREMARVLRPGGRLLIANMNSFVTTRSNPWVRGADGAKLHLAVDNYFEERAEYPEWSGIAIVNWHRPFEAYLGALLATGLRLDAFQEPRPTPADVQQYPSMLDEYRVPLFHVMRWRKNGPASTANAAR